MNLFNHTKEYLIYFILNQFKIVMVIGYLIQARMWSSHLPGKVLMKINENESIIDYVLN